AVITTFISVILLPNYNIFSFNRHKVVITNYTYMFNITHYPILSKLIQLTLLVFLQISYQLVIQIESFFNFIELIKYYKTKKYLLKSDFWIAKKLQKTVFFFDFLKKL